MENRLPRWLSDDFEALIASAMWNSLHVIILPAVLLNFVPDSQKNSYLGVLTFFGLIMALVIQPISGALSDRWASRWGRRRPLIVIGTAFDFVFLAFFDLWQCARRGHRHFHQRQLGVGERPGPGRRSGPPYLTFGIFCLLVPLFPPHLVSCILTAT